MTLHYRNSYIVAKTILQATLNPSSKTTIMYAARLSYEQLKGYLPILAQNALIKQDGGKFETTTKGKEFLDLIIKAEKLLPQS